MRGSRFINWLMVTLGLRPAPPAWTRESYASVAGITGIPVYKTTEDFSDPMIPVGVKPMGEVTIHLDFRDKPRPICRAQPCLTCGGCAICGDFHMYTGRGCTENNCPMQRPVPPDDYEERDEP